MTFDLITYLAYMGVILGGAGVRTPIFGVGGRTPTLYVRQVRNFAWSPTFQTKVTPLNYWLDGSS